MHLNKEDKMKRHLTNSFLLLTGTLLLLGCNTQETKLPTISENGIAAINQFFQGAVDRNEIPGVVAIVANKDQMLYHGAFGKIEVENEVDMRRDAIFDIASMTKPITSVAVMMLHEEGRLDLDDPISKYMPALEDREVIDHFNDTDTTYTTKPVEQEITIRHLLTHTSGLGYDFSNHTLNLLAQKRGIGPLSLGPWDFPLLHEPGSRWTYSMSTRVLGELVEELTGQPFQDFYRARIFDPLGMDDTFYAVPEEKYGRFVTLDQRAGSILNEQPKPEAKDQSVFIVGDGGLRSTATDYVTFLQMFLHNGTLGGAKILSAASIDLMTQNHIGELFVEEQPGVLPALSRAFPMGANRDKFGLGFQITASDGESAYQRAKGSYSWSGLFNTHFWVDPKHEIAVVILMQVLPFYDEFCIRILQGFEEQIYRNLE